MTKDEVIAYQAEKLLSIQFQVKTLRKLSSELNGIWFALQRLDICDDISVVEARNSISSAEAKINKIIELVQDKD